MMDLDEFRRVCDNRHAAMIAAMVAAMPKETDPELAPLIAEATWRAFHFGFTTALSSEADSRVAAGMHRADDLINSKAEALIMALNTLTPHQAGNLIERLEQQGLEAGAIEKVLVTLFEVTKAQERGRGSVGNPGFKTTPGVVRAGVLLVHHLGFGYRPAARVIAAMMATSPDIPSQTEAVIVQTIRNHFC